MRERRSWIDVLKGIAAILVVVGHLVNYNSDIKIYIYSFHMPLFFFYSGYLYKFRDSNKVYIKNKFNKIIKPYFFFSIISIIVSILLKEYSFNIKEIITNILFINGYFMYNSSLWFLIILFYLTVIFQIYSNIRYNLGKEDNLFLDIGTFILILLISVVTSIFQFKTFFGLEIIPSTLLIYYMGYLAKKYKLMNKIKVNNNFYFIIITVGLFLLTYFLSLKNGRVNMSTGQYQNYFLYLLVALLGIILYTIIAKKIDKSRILEMFNSLSLFMFCTQRILFKGYNIIQNRIGITLLDSTNYLVNIIIICITLFIYYLYYLIKKRIKKY